MTVPFFLDYSISADKYSSVFCLGVIQLAVGALGTGRTRQQANFTIRHIDFHLISPFSAAYLTPSSDTWCPMSRASRFNFSRDLTSCQYWVWGSFQLLGMRKENTGPYFAFNYRPCFHPRVPPLPSRYLLPLSPGLRRPVSSCLFPLKACVF